MGQGPAKKWEETLLNLEVAGSEPGIDGEEIVPLAKENVATPWSRLQKSPLLFWTANMFL